MSDQAKSRWPKRLLVTGVVIAALCGGAWYLNNDHVDAVQYQTVAVARGDLVQSVTANGQLSPLVNIQVGSQISGNILRLYADWNSLVKSNQVVAQLDPSVSQASVRSAEADLANAKANLELQQVQEKRAAALLADHLIPESEHDTALAGLHQAEAQVQMKQASLDRSKLDLAHCTIYAPVDGIVISRSVDVGQTVAASMNAPVLFNIANDLAKMQIDANVAEADVGMIETNQPVTFKVDAFPERTFSGMVSQVRNSPTTVQNVVTYDTVISVDNKDLKLKPGMTATVSIITAQHTGVLKIPNAAFRFKPIESPPHQSLVAKLLASVGLGKGPSKPAANSVAGTAAGTNKVESAEGSPPLTVNDPPEELQRRVREMQQRGETVPPEIRAKLRELYQSGVLQAPARGGNPPSGGAGARPAAQALRTVYLLATNSPAGGGEPIIEPVAVRVRTGISDGSFTEVLEGLDEGATIVTAARLPQSSTPTVAGPSPFGGGGRGGMGRGF